jgi:hypothetical protein
MMNHNLSLNLAIEALEYIKKNNPSFFNDKDYISKAQLSLVDIRDDCKINKRLDINQYNI